jgi:hypothetical protein
MYITQAKFTSEFNWTFSVVFWIIDLTLLKTCWTARQQEINRDPLVFKVKQKRSRVRETLSYVVIGDAVKADFVSVIWDYYMADEHNFHDYYMADEHTFQNSSDFFF